MRFPSTAALLGTTALVGALASAFTLHHAHEQEALNLAGAKLVDEFSTGRTNAAVYELDNRDGHGVEHFVSTMNAQGAAKRQADGFLIFDVRGRSVSVEVPPTYLGMVKGVPHYRTSGGRDMAVKSKSPLQFLKLQVVVTTPRSELRRFLGL